MSSRPPGGSGRRLCMVVHSYYPVGEPRVEREAKAARDAGYQVFVVALRQPEEPKVEKIDGITALRVDLQHARGATLPRVAFEYIAFTLIATARVLQLHLRTALDVVHVHAPPDFLVVAGAIPKRLGANLVLDVHDLSPHMYGARFERRMGLRWVTAALRLVERLACRLADHVVTVHEPYRNELTANGVPRDKITVIMNSPDEALLDRVRNRALPPDDAAGFTVAYHGTITAWYGVDLLIEAIASLDGQIPGLDALVLGDGDALEAAERLAAKLGVADHVRFSRRYLPIEQTLASVQGASCGVIPNRPSMLNRFALSSKLFEYVALGVPVVVSRLQTLADHFNDTEVTFFDPGNAESLAAAIDWVARNPEAAREKAARARARAGSYAWKKNRERYQGLLGQGAA